MCSAAFLWQTPTSSECVSLIGALRKHYWACITPGVARHCHDRSAAASIMILLRLSTWSAASKTTP